MSHLSTYRIQLQLKKSDLVRVLKQSKELARVDGILRQEMTGRDLELTI